MFLCGHCPRRSSRPQPRSSWAVSTSRSSMPKGHQQGPAVVFCKLHFAGKTFTFCLVDQWPNILAESRILYYFRMTLWLLWKGSYFITWNRKNEINENNIVHFHVPLKIHICKIQAHCTITNTLHTIGIVCRYFDYIFGYKKKQNTKWEPKKTFGEAVTQLQVLITSTDSECDGFPDPKADESCE